MLDRGVARDEIHEEAQAARVAGRDQRVEVVERPVLGRDVGVVADVVAEVVLAGAGYIGESQMASTPREASVPRRWSSRWRMPSRSPMPSPFASAKLRG